MRLAAQVGLALAVGAAIALLRRALRVPVAEGPAVRSAAQLSATPASTLRLPTAPAGNCSPAAGAVFTAVEYAPSEIERYWSANIASWQLNLTGKGGVQGPFQCRRGRARCGWHVACLEVMRDEARIRTLLGQAADHRKVRPPTPSTHTLLSTLKRSAPPGSGCVEAQAAPIEPLVSFLRDPRDFCLTREVVVTLGTDWIVLPWAADVLVPPVREAVLLDAGASEDWTGSVQRIVEMYRGHGVEFSSVTAWEMLPDATRFTSSVPSDWKGRLDFRHRAATHEPGHPDNPITVAKQLRKGGRAYVVLKLDIDSPWIEEEVVAQILREPWVVDELFWEHHARYSPMVRYWCGKRRIPEGAGATCGHVSNLTLADGYRLLERLRAAGVRAHGWI